MHTPVVYQKAKCLTSARKLKKKIRYYTFLKKSYFTQVMLNILLWVVARKGHCSATKSGLFLERILLSLQKKFVSFKKAVVNYHYIAKNVNG